jgi:hypothetical protein
LQKRGLRYKEFKIFDQTLGIKASTQACPSWRSLCYFLHVHCYM